MNDFENFSVESGEGNQSTYKFEFIDPVTGEKDSMELTAVNDEEARHAFQEATGIDPEKDIYVQMTMDASVASNDEFPRQDAA